MGLHFHLMTIDYRTFTFSFPPVSTFPILPYVALFPSCRSTTLNLKYQYEKNWKQVKHGTKMEEFKLWCLMGLNIIMLFIMSIVSWLPRMHFYSCNCKAAVDVRMSKPVKNFYKNLFESNRWQLAGSKISSAPEFCSFCMHLKLRRECEDDRWEKQGWDWITG